MKDKVRVAFVGSGGIARSHLEGLVKFPDVELVGFCDVRAETAAETIQKFAPKAAMFGTAVEVMDATKPDAVYLCLPPFGHGEAEREAIKRKIPFFVEKPIHLDYNDAKEISALVDKKNLLTCVGYMNRYRRGVQRVRELARKDKPILVHGGWIGGTPKPPPGVTNIWSWWVTKEKSGGQLHEQSTHTFDIARYLCGDAKEVYTVAARGFVKDVAGYTNDDASHCVIRFKSGAIADIYSSCSTNQGGGINLNVYGGQFCAKFTGWEHSVKIERSKIESEEIKGEEKIFEIEDRVFIDAVKRNDKKAPLSNYADGLKTLRLTLAANESIVTGKPVAL